MKSAFAFIAVLTLAGCATKTMVKPTMTETEARQQGKIIARHTQCVHNGHMDTYLAAQGRDLFRAYREGFAFEPTQIEQGYREAMASGTPPTKEQCVEMALSIQTTVNALNANKSRSEQQQRILNRPTQTNCSLIANQLLCNSL